MSILGRIALAFVVAVTVTACGDEPETVVDDQSATGSAIEEPVAATSIGEPGQLMIQEVRLDPKKPLSGKQLTVRVRARTSDDKRPELSYEWYVRGRLVSEDGSTIRLPELRKGDHIRVMVEAREPGAPSVKLAQEATVANAAPRIRDLRLRKRVVGDAGEEWLAEVDATDPDGDQVRYEYTWLVNGQPHSERGPSFKSQLLKRSDQLQLQVVANDGEASSNMAQTGVVTVANSAPEISSSPPQLGSDGRFSYQLAVSDADGDKQLKYTLEEGPRGMSIDSQSGLVSWQPSADQGGRHRVQVSVDDRKGGKSSQEFDLAIVVETQVGPAAQR